MVSVPVWVESIHPSCRFVWSSVRSSRLFLPQLLLTQVLVQPVCECSWLNLNLTESGVVFADINIVCETKSVKITWTIPQELVPYAARFFLGNCMASTFNVLPSEEGELYFESNFDECKFKRKVMLIKCSI